MLHTELKVVAVGEPDLIFLLSCATTAKTKGKKPEQYLYCYVY